MILNFYTIYDKKAQESGNIFTAKNDLVAIRNTRQILENIPFKQEYELKRLGQIDTESCYISLDTPPETVDFLNLKDLEVKDGKDSSTTV